MDVVKNHEFAMVKRPAGWEVIESAELKRAKTALKKETDFVSALLDNTETLVVVLDPQGRIVRANRMCRELTGRPDDQLVGQHFWEVFDVLRDPGPLLAYFRALEERRPTLGFETVMVSVRGRREISWSNVALDTGGPLAHVVATGTDITEHRRAQHSLRLAYEEEHRVATTLQETFMRPLPAVRGLEIGVAYKASIEAQRVGGDFYDVFELEDGRVAVLVGDVAGKGIEAAGLTETVRSTVRALAHFERSPAAVLREANQVLRDQMPADRFVTAALLVIDPSTGETAYASAGLPPAILLPREGPALEPPVGLPLGLFEAEYGELTFELERGRSVLVFTDGLGEARRASDMFYDLLPEVLVALGPARPQELADGLLRAAEAFTSGALSDDIVIVAVRRRQTGQ